MNEQATEIHSAQAQLLGTEEYRLVVVPTGFLIEKKTLGGLAFRKVDHSEEMLLWALSALARLSCATAPGYESWWPQWMHANKAKLTSDDFLEWRRPRPRDGGGD